MTDMISNVAATRSSSLSPSVDAIASGLMTAQAERTRPTAAFASGSKILYELIVMWRRE